MQIADKVFVVTGGGNGIGREVALELLRRGARVAAVDLSEAGLA
ncbi:MAG: SDR family NAD(P)-dependent oxidoreductase, partial [Candidatus Nanopelagicales bacterium]